MLIKLRATPGTQCTPVLDDEGVCIGCDIVPFFPTERGTTYPLHGTSLAADGRVLDKFVLIVPAMSGKVRRQERNASFVPFVDLPHSERKKAPVIEEEVEEAEDPDKDYTDRA